MSVKDITALRKSGQLEAAYQMALSELQADPSNAWSQMAMFWVLRDRCLNEYIPQQRQDDFMKTLVQMERLLPTMMDNQGIGQKAYEALSRRLNPRTEAIAKAAQLAKTNATAAYQQVANYIKQPTDFTPACQEELGWILFHYLKEKQSDLTSIEIRTLLRDYMNLSNPRPSMLHSNILNIANHFAVSHRDFNFYRFFLMWNPLLLRKEDYHKQQFNDKEIPSLVVRVCRTLVETDAAYDIDELHQKLRLKKPVVVSLLCEPAFWQLIQLQKADDTHAFFEKLAYYAQRFAAAGPSKWHSKHLELAVRCMVEAESWRFVPYFRTWKAENLSPFDWKEQTDEQGYTHKPLAPTAIKKSFECLKNMSKKDPEQLDWLGQLYECLLTKNPDDEWAPRQRAMLYVWQQKYDQALQIYRQLVLQKSEKYYIWSEMAACVPQNPSLQLALYYKALSMERNEKFLGEIHLSVAKGLLDEGKTAEALHQLQSYKQTRDNEGWGVSAEYTQLLRAIDSNVVPAALSPTLADEYIATAEDFAFSELPWVLYSLVDRWENEGKTRCLFADVKGNTLVVNANRFRGLHKLPLGKQVKMRVLSPATTLCMHKTEGELWQMFPLKYGYIDYIHPANKKLHILTEDSHHIVCLPPKGKFKQGGYVTLRECTLNQLCETSYRAGDIRQVDAQQALPHFPTALAVVDTVNEVKELFHFATDSDPVSGVVHFSDTLLRPFVGQILRISYCLSQDKKGQLRCRVLRMDTTDETSSKLVRDVSDILTIHSKTVNGKESYFGFIGGCYVSEDLLNEHHVDDDTSASAEVVYTGKGKWKAIKLYDIL